MDLDPLGITLKITHSQLGVFDKTRRLKINRLTHQHGMVFSDTVLDNYRTCCGRTFHALLALKSSLTYQFHGHNDSFFLAKLAYDKG